MKKSIEIKKKIDFSSMIGEISSISLENHLQFVDCNHIEGNLTVFGHYKTTVASQLDEEFHYDIPIDITLTEDVDYLTGKIDITDFYYDVVEDHSLLCNVELSIEADELLEEERECDGDPIETKEIEIPHMEEQDLQNTLVDRPAIEETTNSFFQIDETETYGTFLVYIMRENETINSIIEKYHTNIEEIEKYNDIQNLMIGSKIIIPVTHAEDTE